MRGEWERSSYGWTDLKPSTALNSSFHCAPKVSLQSSIFQDREVENSEATCFWRNLDFYFIILPSDKKHFRKDLHRRSGCLVLQNNNNASKN